MSASIRITGAALFGALYLVPSAAAQVRFEVVPVVGFHVPTTRVIDHDIRTICQVICPQYNFSVKQDLSPMMGSRFVVISLQGQVGMEASFTYSASRLTATDSRGGIMTHTADTTARVMNLSVKLLVPLSPPAARAAVHVGAGPSLIRYDVLAARYAGGTTKFGGILGVGATFRATPRMALRLDAEDRVFSARPDAAKGRTDDPPLQNDLVFSLGLSLGLGRP